MKKIFTFFFVIFHHASLFATEVNDPYEKDRYIVFFLSNIKIEEALKYNSGKEANTAFNYISELPYLFGTIKKESKFKYAFGILGPMLLTQSVEEMRIQVNNAFDAAEKYNVPVYFQLDDCNNYTAELGSGANPKFYENPDWFEWIAFARPGQKWGGQSFGRPAYFWFNWGSWTRANAFPCFQSPGFRKFVVDRINKGFIEPLIKRYKKLKKNNKEYLFAGVAVGWETHIPDFSPSNTLMKFDTTNLPVDRKTGEQMQKWELSKFGYNALSILGQKKYNVDVLYQVIHDYSELLSKSVFDAGIPKHKIYTHIIGLMSSSPELRTSFAPPIWTAVNSYSVPGFTLSPITCPYNLAVLKSEIIKADPDQKYFVLAEGYGVGVDDTEEHADQYFTSMFDNGALMVTVFGWGKESSTSIFAVSHNEESPFVVAARKWLNK